MTDRVYLHVIAARRDATGSPSLGTGNLSCARRTGTFIRNLNKYRIIQPQWYSESCGRYIRCWSSPLRPIPSDWVSDG